MDVSGSPEDRRTTCTHTKWDRDKNTGHGQKRKPEPQYTGTVRTRTGSESLEEFWRESKVGRSIGMTETGNGPIEPIQEGLKSSIKTSLLVISGH